jgi:hypothetical protein
LAAAGATSRTRSTTRTHYNSERGVAYVHSQATPESTSSGDVPGIDPRFKTTILFVADYRMLNARPEADPFNFVPRIRIPVLMLNAIR